MTRVSGPVVVALVAALVVAPVAVMAMPGTTSPTASPAAQPGEKLSGAVAAQQAEVDGEVSERTFAVRVARADGNASKAAVVADQVQDVDQRLTELQQEKRRLIEAKRNGSISTAEFRAEMAALAVRIRTVQRLANRSEQVARGLPADVRQRQGVNVTAIQELSSRARNLSGPQVAEIARSVAGNDTGKPMGPPGQPGGRPGSGNGSNPGQGGPPADDPGGGRNDTGEGRHNGTDTGR